jgi:hypothetical protein
LKEERVKRLAVWASILIVFGASSIALATPDLVVTDLSLSPGRPQVGERVTITATVKNAGTSDADHSFTVLLSIDGEGIETASVPFGIDRGRSKIVTFDWSAEVGTHTLVVEADRPFDRIDESDEANNALMASLVVPIAMSSSHLADLKVAVARFEDRSGSGFINVGEGVADALVERLVNSGIRVLERSELEAVMQERGLNPALVGDLSAAGQVLGADLLIVGSVTDVSVQQATFSLGLFSISSASVDVSMLARLVNVYSSEVMKAVSVEGQEEGATGFSVDIGKIVALSQPAPVGVCGGGLATDKSSYYLSETVHVGYRHAGASDWYQVHMYTGSGTWLKSLNWQFLNAGDCGEWFWDQRDGFGLQMSPGTYTAKLYEFGSSSYVAAVGFQIGPGGGMIHPLFDEITVGSTQFDETIVGKATDTALNQLVTELIRGMEEVAPAVAEMRGEVSTGAHAPTTPREGQVAAVLSDGRIAVTIGTSTGLSRGDFLEVLQTGNLVLDPNTGAVLAYDVLGIKGELVLVEVRDRVSYGVKTTEFDLLIGDIVRLIGY